MAALAEDMKKIQGMIEEKYPTYGRACGVKIWFVEEGLQPGTGGWQAAGYGPHGQVGGAGQFAETPEQAVADLVPRIERVLEYYEVEQSEPESYKSSLDRMLDESEGDEYISNFQEY